MQSTPDTPSPALQRCRLPWRQDPGNPARWYLDLPQQAYVLMDYGLSGAPYAESVASPWTGVRLLNGGCVALLAGGHWRDVPTAIRDLEGPMRERLLDVAQRVKCQASDLHVAAIALEDAVYS